MDRRGHFRSPDDVESDGLVGIAPETANLEIAMARVQRLAEHRGGLCRSFVAEHAFVPGFAGESIGLFARFLGSLRCHADGVAVEMFAQSGCRAAGFRKPDCSAQNRTLGATRSADCSNRGQLIFGRADQKMPQSQ